MRSIIKIIKQSVAFLQCMWMHVCVCVHVCVCCVHVCVCVCSCVCLLRACVGVCTAMQNGESFCADLHC